MFDNSKYKNDLKIVVDNTNQASNKESDVLIIESGDLVEEMDENPALLTTSSSNQQMGSNDVHTVEMQSETDETEFHVNLDKVPLSLKNTVLASKVYINDSFDKIQVEEKTINEIDLKSLYLSLQIDEESFVESTFNANYYRRDALHLIGVDEMSTAEVFEYFNSYKPFSIEWISDNVCNVVWKDSYLMTLALIELSKPYGEEEGFEKNESSQKSEEAGEIEADTEVGVEDAKKEELVRLPPGRWRVGNAAAKKGNQVFLRYARINDKKQKGAESRSEYYRKYGNPNYGNLRGLISTSKRTKLKATVFKKLNGDIEEDEEVFEPSYDDRDSWGTKSSKEILTRIRMPNDRERSDVNNNEKSQRKMRMYIDDYDEKASSKRKRNDDESNSDSGSDDDRDRRSRSPKVIRKPVDARSYLEMRKSSRSDHRHHDSKRVKTDLRDTLKHKHRR